MEIPNSTFEDIVNRYLRSELTKEEKRVFEERLEADVQFKEKFEEHQLVVEELKRLFFQNEVEAYIAKKANEQNTPPGQAPSRPKFSPWIILVVLLFSLGLISWFIYSVNKSAESVKEEPIRAEVLPTQGDEEPLVSASETFEMILNSSLNIIVFDPGNQSKKLGDQIQVVIKTRKDQESGYLLSSDRRQLNIWCPESALPEIKIIALVDRNEKRLYLQLAKSWFPIIPSDGELLLQQEEDQVILRSLNNAI